MIALVEKPVEKPVANGAAPVVEPVPIEKLKQTVSASRLNCWLQCRLKFYFRYVLKITKPKTAALHFGSVVHLVLQQWNLDRWRRQPFEITKIEAGVRDRLAGPGHDQLGRRGDGPEEHSVERIGEILHGHANQSQRNAEAVEVPVEADWANTDCPC